MPLLLTPLSSSIWQGFQGTLLPLVLFFLMTFWNKVISAPGIDTRVTCRPFFVLDVIQQGQGGKPGIDWVKPSLSSWLRNDLNRNIILFSPHIPAEVSLVSDYATVKDCRRKFQHFSPKMFTLEWGRKRNVPSTGWSVLPWKKVTNLYLRCGEAKQQLKRESCSAHLFSREEESSREASADLQLSRYQRNIIWNCCIHLFAI